MEDLVSMIEQEQEQLSAFEGILMVSVDFTMEQYSCSSNSASSALGIVFLFLI